MSRPENGRRCKSCLLYDGMRFYLIRDVLPTDLLEGFHIAADGVCSICHAYRDAYDRGGIERDLELFRRSTAGVHRPAALLALSGGKDSMSALYLARRVLRLDLVALLFDNGFVPREVVARARRACASLQVELEVVRAPARWRQSFGDAVDAAGLSSPPPCNVCGAEIIEALADRAAALGTPWVIWGTNYFAAWTDRPSAVGRRLLSAGRQLAEINLPYAMQIKAAAARANAKRLGATPVAIPGVSTNCLVPHQVARALLPTLGHVPELEVLALEVIVGHCSRRAALRTLRERTTP
ncbi:MAG: hypothetical protein HY903_12205 [Deltaproteobacteria bacterium]|nr:hypothetical protein [Deltaproteobacteria bacterium]